MQHLRLSGYIAGRAGPMAMSEARAGAAPGAVFAIPGDIATLTGGYTYDRRLIEALSQIGAPVRHVALDATWPDPSPAAIAELRSLLQDAPSGLPVLLDGLAFGAMPTDMLQGLTRPVIAMLHHPLGLEAGLPAARAAALIAREKANLRHAAHVIVTSHHTRDVLVTQFDVPQNKITVALPGFDRPAPVTPATRSGPPLILSVGIICQRKGHDVLLAALARITHLPWRCVIAGMVQDHALHAELCAQRDRAGLAGRVDFAGQVDVENLQVLYRQAHVFALATRYEGYGMVLSEAQLHGLPIISCDVGAVPQTVGVDGAILTAPDDVDAFATGLEKLLTDPAEAARLSRSSARNAQALPRWTDTAQNARRVIEAVRAS